MCPGRSVAQRAPTGPRASQISGARGARYDISVRAQQPGLSGHMPVRGVAEPLPTAHHDGNVDGRPVVL